MIEERIYSSKGSSNSVIRGFFSDSKQARELGYRLFVRDFKALYRQSFLGYFWVFLPPLFTSLIWIMLNGSGVVKIASTDIPYPVFVFVGTMLWQTFADAIQNIVKSVTVNKPTLIKLNFPHESIIISAFYTTLFNFLMKLVLIVLILIFFKVPIGASALLFFLGVIALIILGTSIGIILSPVAMLYGDIAKAVPILLQFFMYLTPVIYPEPRIGLFKKFLMLNPVAPLITASRNWLVGNEYESLVQFLIVTVLAILLSLVGMIIFKVSMPIVIERSGS